MMAQRDILEAFNDCIDRLNDGATMADCLRLYPQYADDLRIMLDAGRLVNRARIDPFEVHAAQEQGRARVLATLQAAPPRSNITSFRRFLTLAASIILILGVFLGGAGLAAETSLPGDPLYGFKRLTESARLLMPGVAVDLQESFAQRRVDEVRQLLAINRPETVDFSGAVEVIDGESWTIAGLPITVPTGTPGAASIKVSDVVAVQAQTTATGQLMATQLTLVDSGDVLTTTPTQVPTVESTVTPTPTVTSTSTPTHTTTPPPSATVTPTVHWSPTPEVCVPTAPSGWVSYQVATGDTLSGLASATGVLMDEVIDANCLESTVIYVGETLFLPFAPQVQVSPIQVQTPSSMSGPDSGTSTSDDSGDSSDDDSDSDSDDDHDDDDHDDDGSDDDEDRSGSNKGSG